MQGSQAAKVEATRAATLHEVSREDGPRASVLQNACAHRLRTTHSNTGSRRLALDLCECWVTAAGFGVFAALGGMAVSCGTCMAEPDACQGLSVWGMARTWLGEVGSVDFLEVGCVGCRGRGCQKRL